MPTVMVAGPGDLRLCQRQRQFRQLPVYIPYPWQRRTRFSWGALVEGGTWVSPGSIPTYPSVLWGMWVWQLGAALGIVAVLFGRKSYFHYGRDFRHGDYQSFCKSHLSK